MISLLLRSLFAECPPLAHSDESRVKDKEQSDEASLLGPKASLRRGESDETMIILRREPILLIFDALLDVQHADDGITDRGKPERGIGNVHGIPT